MAIHFYDESSSPPGEELARLKTSSLLHLLVQDERVADAVEIICREPRYSPIDAASDGRWGDYAMYNFIQPFAFDGTPTTLLQQ
ncbi:hypothetical protein PTI98_008357 [Pleurotus ostreatus]|nr:hypothetical protein PTI98_008357 [Pleurotus ostreatus]